MLYGVAISGLGSSVPENTVTNTDLEKILDTTADWITERTGITERHIVPAGVEDTLYLSVDAAKKALQGRDPADIDLIIVATATSDYMYPSTACRLQAEIGAVNAACFDVSAACSGFVYALVTASQYLMCGSYRHALVVGVDVHSRFLDWSDRTTAILFGDGAGAVLLSACSASSNQMLAHHLYSDGRGAADLTIRTSAGGFGQVSESVPFHGVRMNGKKIYQFAVQSLTDIIHKVLTKAHVETDQIDYFVFHQANQRILSAVCERLSVPMDRCPSNISRYGNTSSASIPLLLDDLRESLPNKLLCISGFGAGLTVASVVWRMGSLA